MFPLLNTLHTFANLYLQWHIFLFNLWTFFVIFIHRNVNVFPTNPAPIFGLSQWLLATFLWLLNHRIILIIELSSWIIIPAASCVFQETTLLSKRQFTSSHNYLKIVIWPYCPTEIVREVTRKINVSPRRKDHNKLFAIQTCLVFFSRNLGLLAVSFFRWDHCVFTSAIKMSLNCHTVYII